MILFLGHAAHIMDTAFSVIQDPAPGIHLLMFRGDTRTFTLTLSRAEKGS
ncbi:MAG: hypothetical protein ISS65_04795, partial [Desulfobacterales bacterium]|nr:hypothetical protein [Desulfobacterales bacterium]